MSKHHQIKCKNVVKMILFRFLGMAERWTAVVSMVIGYLMCFGLITCLISTVGGMSVSGNEYKKKVLLSYFYFFKLKADIYSTNNYMN